eukprot:Em0019g1186a
MGYGLMGINILGQSQMNGSSFVGNNQFVKDNLQLYSPAATYCNDGSNYIARSFYVNTATSGNNVYAGGNAVFVFYQLSNYSAEPVLKISFCLFALGIDGSIGLQNGNTFSIFNSMGTGLGIQMPQNAYGISIIITNTIAYGNQAFLGANFNLLVNPASGGIMLSGVYSARGVSWIGGGLYININPLLPDQNAITLLNSALSTDYNPDSGIYILVPNQITASMMVQIEHSTLSSNLVLLSADTGISAMGISATINNTLFGVTGCSGGIGAFYASLKLSNCTFSRTNLYASQSYFEIEDSTFENSLFSANDLYYTHLFLKGNVSYVNNKATLYGGAQILAVHKHCPYDYCIATDISFAVLDDQDAQCAHDHSGVLCGRCKPHLSAVFGSAQCKLCNDNYVWLLIPISIMGVVMVAFLFLLNCTVSVGTLNGLILYTNIIRPGILNLLPTTSQNCFEKLLVVFVDWMNLDLGIETCFYDGMDTYAKTWLELLFPVYLLAMVAAIIIGSRWSSKLAWISKRNAVAMLATLVLLSYTALLQSVLTIFSYTHLDVAIEPNIHNPTVWLADGNILIGTGTGLGYTL